MHLVGFIIKKFVTMHGHMNVKFFANKFVALSRRYHFRIPVNICVLFIDSMLVPALISRS